MDEREWRQIDGEQARTNRQRGKRDIHIEENGLEPTERERERDVEKARTNRERDIDGE